MQLIYLGVFLVSRAHMTVSQVCFAVSVERCVHSRIPILYLSAWMVIVIQLILEIFSATVLGFSQYVNSRCWLAVLFPECHCVRLCCKLCCATRTLHVAVRPLNFRALAAQIHQVVCGPIIDSLNPCIVASCITTSTIC